MTTELPRRAHVIAGGFPPGKPAGHDHDYARLRLLKELEAAEAPASVGNDYTDLWRWLPLSRLLITYVAGPYPDDEQNKVLRGWLEEGGHWVALHGTSGGKARRVGDGRQRAMVKGPYHETLGGFFINHPPVRRYRVDVRDHKSPLAKNMPDSFEITDELYMIEIQDLAATDILLTTELDHDPSPPGFGFIYEKDTSLLEDGKTRVIGYTRPVGKGGVTYIAPGHCHTPSTNSQPFVDASVSADGKTPLTLRNTWETEAYSTLITNAVEWGLSS
jgi:hypothetical protein